MRRVKQQGWLLLKGQEEQDSPIDTCTFFYNLSICMIKYRGKQLESHYCEQRSEVYHDFFNIKI